jgi:hypothetical protein
MLRGSPESGSAWNRISGSPGIETSQPCRVLIKVFASPDLADEWFKENDPEGVAFEYEVVDR